MKFISESDSTRLTSHESAFEAVRKALVTRPMISRLVCLSRSVKLGVHVSMADGSLKRADAPPGASAPKLVNRGMLSSMRKGAVIVDVAIDQGGCFETSRPTTHDDPTYEVNGVIHYCVANMPGAVPLTSSQALNNAALPFGLALANKGFAAVLENPDLRAGLNVHRGRLTSEAVAESLGLPCSPIEQVAA